MQKNIFLKEDKFFSSFKEFIYKVYSSKLMMQIFYYFEEFRDFIYPFEGEDKDDIFKEMLLLTKFYPFNFDILHEYTSMIFPKVIISSIIKENNSKENIFSKILNNDLESDNKLNEESLQKFLQIVKMKKELIKVKTISKDEMEELINSDGG